MKNAATALFSHLCYSRIIEITTNRVASDGQP